MTSKNCTKCGKLKPLEEFKKRRAGKQGLNSECGDCQTVRYLNYGRTINGLLKLIYKGQRHSSKKRGHPDPEYTFGEFKEWVSRQCNFDSLFSAWKKSGWTKSLKPSVDRINSSIPYMFSNIQLVTWAENQHNWAQEIVSGADLRTSKPVAQISKTGELIKIFHSSRHAERSTGVHHSNISRCCSANHTNYKTAKGFKWMYAHQWCDFWQKKQKSEELFK